MKTLILDRADFRTDLDPFLWENLLDQMFDESELPESRENYPDSVIVKVAKAEIDF